MGKPRTVAVTYEDHGEWVPFKEGVHRYVHAIKFSDGSIWDAHNGWRNIKDRYPETPFEDRPEESITRFVKCEQSTNMDIEFVFETVMYEYNTPIKTVVKRVSLADFVDRRK